MARSPGENALWLKPLRLKHQLTQAEMAKHLDIDPSYYAKVERGQKRPARLTPNKEAPHWLHEARELNKKAPSQTSEAAKLTEEETKPFSDGSGNRLPHLVPANTHPAGNYDWIDPQLPNLQQKFATEFALATDQTATIEQYYREVLERIQLARRQASSAQTHFYRLLDAYRVSQTAKQSPSLAGFPLAKGALLAAKRELNLRKSALDSFERKYLEPIQSLRYEKRRDRLPKECNDIIFDSFRASLSDFTHSDYNRTDSALCELFGSANRVRKEWSLALGRKASCELVLRPVLNCLHFLQDRGDEKHLSRDPLPSSLLWGSKFFEVWLDESNGELARSLGRSLAKIYSLEALNRTLELCQDKVDEFQIENTFTLYNDWGHHNGFDYGVSIESVEDWRKNCDGLKMLRAFYVKS